MRRNSKYYGLDFWKLDKFRESEAVLMVPLENDIELTNTFREKNLTFSPLIQDVETLFQQDCASSEFEPYDKSEDPSFVKYLRHDEINQQLINYAKKYPKRVIVETVGHSSEGRELKTITILANPNTTTPNTIFIDAAIHAREWIAPATALFVIDQILKAPNEGKYDHQLEKIQWVFLPVVNPDG